MQTQIKVNTEALIKELTEVENQEETLEVSRLELSFRKGRILLQIKEGLPHGEFLPFLKAAKVQTNPRQAQRMMELATNEDLIRAKTTNSSYLTIEKAMAMIKKKKQSEQSEKEIVTQIVGQFNVSTAFNAESQTYGIMVHIKAEDRKWMKCKTNQKSAIAAVKKALNQLVESPCLTDMATMSPN